MFDHIQGFNVLIQYGQDGVWAKNDKSSYKNPNGRGNLIIGYNVNGSQAGSSHNFVSLKLEIMTFHTMIDPIYLYVYIHDISHIHTRTYIYTL